MPKVPLKTFIEFARTKPSDEDFDAGDINNCALAQFGRSYLEHDRVSAGSSYFRDKDGIDEYDQDGENPAVFRIDVSSVDHLWLAIDQTRNWGALTARLEALDVNN